MIYVTKRGLTRYIFVLLATLLPLVAGARESYPLNTNWKIFASVDGSADNAKNISLPHCWNRSAATPVSHASMDFIRRIYAPKEWADKRIFVKFYGVQSAAEFLINGRYVGEHRGGSTAFVFEISKLLKLGEDNGLIMKVSAMPQNNILPTSVDYETYGGIYRDVELIVTPKTAFNPNIYGADGLFVTTNSIEDGVAKGRVKLHLTSMEDVGEHEVVVKFRDRSGRIVGQNRVSKAKVGKGESKVEVAFEIENVDVWSPQTPVLYDVTAELYEVVTKGKEVSKQLVDQISTTTGMRTIQLAKDGSVKGAVSINNTPTLMRGVSYQHDNPEQGGITSREVLQRDVDQVKSLGANAIRSVIVPHDRALYEICDREGIMVWVDTPLSHSRTFSDVAYYPTTAFEQNGMQQLNEIIHQNYNHPSIVMWGVFSLLNANDSKATAYIKRLNDRAKEIDNRRPTVAISNQNGDINEIPDLVVWQQDLGWSRGMLSDIVVWQNQLHSSWSKFRSAVAYGAAGRTEHQEDRSELVYRRGKLTDDWLPEVRQSRLHEEYSDALVDDSLFWGVWINNMYDYRSPRSDYGFSHYGLTSFDRATHKDSYYLYRALWNADEATLHIVDKRNNLLLDSIISVRVYASPIEGSMPRLVVGGKSMEMKNIAPAQYIYENLLIVGSTPLRVEYGTLVDSVEFIHGSPLRARKN